MASLCKNCGGSLIFAPDKKALYCKMCGSTFNPESVEGDSKKLLEDVDATPAVKLFGSKSKSLYECNVYTCSTCGGDIIINQTEISTFCIYCGNPTVVFKRVSKEMRPDGIVPFYVSKDEAKMLIKNRISQGPFVPAEIKRLDLQDIKGIYVPYWVVNCEFHDAVIVDGYERYVKNPHQYYYGRSGECSFRSIPFDASLKLNDNMSQRLEPFFFDDAKAFDEDYLNGFYSDTSDISVNDLRTAVLKRCDKLFCEEVVKSVNADDKKVVKTTPSVDIHEDAVYLLLPVWFYTYKYANKPYTILVNGQTGKVVGSVTTDKRKVAIWSAVIFLLLFALMCIPLIFLKGEPLMLFSSLMTVIPVLCGALIWKSRTKIQSLKESLSQSQSGSTFLFAEKRQVT